MRYLGLSSTWKYHVEVTKTRFVNARNALILPGTKKDSSITNLPEDDGVYKFSFLLFWFFFKLGSLSCFSIFLIL